SDVLPLYGPWGGEFGRSAVHGRRRRPGRLRGDRIGGRARCVRPARLTAAHVFATGTRAPLCARRGVAPAGGSAGTRGDPPTGPGPARGPRAAARHGLPRHP